MGGKLKQIAEARGVEVVNRGNGHWQLKGPLLVNYYPDSKSKSAYVAGTKKARKGVTPEEAVNMCFQAPQLQGAKDKRKNGSRAKRAALIRRGVTSCHWCNKPLTLDDSTLEHIIPLAIGGLDNANNRTLACAGCNHGRGSKMAELTATA